MWSVRGSCWIFCARKRAVGAGTANPRAPNSLEPVTKSRDCGQIASAPGATDRAVLYVRRPRERGRKPRDARKTAIVVGVQTVRCSSLDFRTFICCERPQSPVAALFVGFCARRTSSTPPQNPPHALPRVIRARSRDDKSAKLEPRRTCKKPPMKSPPTGSNQDVQVRIFRDGTTASGEVHPPA